MHDFCPLMANLLSRGSLMSQHLQWLLKHPRLVEMLLGDSDASHPQKWVTHSADLGFLEKNSKTFCFLDIFPHLLLNPHGHQDLGFKVSGRKPISRMADKRIGHDQAVEPNVNCMTVLLRVSWNLVPEPAILRPHTEFLNISWFQKKNHNQVW